MTFPGEVEQLERIVITISHADGSTTTYRAESPQRPEVVFLMPGRLPDIGPADPELIVPGTSFHSMRVKVQFDAGLRHQIICERVQQPLPDVLAAYRRATGWTDSEALQRAAEVEART